MCDVNTSPEQLEQLVAEADILVLAAGVKHLIEPARFRLSPGCIVLDAGISVEAAGGGGGGGVGQGLPKIYGDVHPDLLKRRGGPAWYTPVPGGLGPVTVAMLVSNLLLAASRQLDGRSGPRAAKL